MNARRAAVVTLRSVPSQAADEVAEARAEIERLRAEIADAVPMKVHRGVKNELQRKRGELRIARALLAAAIKGE